MVHLLTLFRNPLTGKKAHHLYIIDYGLAKKYVDSATNEHIPFRDGGRGAVTGGLRVCHVMLCHDMLCYVMYVMLCYVMTWYVKLCGSNFFSGFFLCAMIFHGCGSVYGSGHGFVESECGGD